MVFPQPLSASFIVVNSNPKEILETEKFHLLSAYPYETRIERQAGLLTLSPRQGFLGEVVTAASEPDPVLWTGMMRSQGRSVCHSPGDSGSGAFHLFKTRNVYTQNTVAMFYKDN